MLDAQLAFGKELARLESEYLVDAFTVLAPRGFGGHASVCGLQINVGRVVAVYKMNLLEDDAGLEVPVLEQTAGEEAQEGGHQQSGEMVTTKLVLAKEV